MRLILLTLQFGPHNFSSHITYNMCIHHWHQLPLFCDSYWRCKGTCWSFTTSLTALTRQEIGRRGPFVWRPSPWTTTSVPPMSVPPWQAWPSHPSGPTWRSVTWMGRCGCTSSLRSSSVILRDGERRICARALSVNMLYLALPLFVHWIMLVKPITAHPSELTVRLIDFKIN